MTNQVPGRLGCKLTTPFEAIHNKKPDSKTWFKLFSMGCVDHTIYNAKKKSKTEDQTLYGIAVGRDDNSETVIFYYPLTKSYYRPPAFCWMKGGSLSPTSPNQFRGMAALYVVYTVIV